MVGNNSTGNLPLLKWPGGKRFLVKHILPLVPRHYNGYFEPFVGSGALFFALKPKRSILADVSADLINCYIQVRDRPDEVIAHLGTMKNSAADYYQVRKSKPPDAISQAARLIYLTTLSFNGIHRVNTRGEFNVPYGHKTHLNVCDPFKIYTASAALASSHLLHEDFDASLANATEGDLVYLDPPYTVAHGNNGFLKYNATIFSWADQRRLASVAHQLANRGCHVLVSNADHPSIEELYSDFRVKRIARASVIAASAGHRRGVTECVFYN